MPLASSRIRRLQRREQMQVRHYQDFPFIIARRKRIDRIVLPHVGPITPKPSQLNVVTMILLAIPEDENQLMA